MTNTLRNSERQALSLLVPGPYSSESIDIELPRDTVKNLQALAVVTLLPTAPLVTRQQCPLQIHMILLGLTITVPTAMLQIACDPTKPITHSIGLFNLTQY